jgi:hypothetical protein
MVSVIVVRSQGSSASWLVGVRVRSYMARLVFDAVEREYYSQVRSDELSTTVP